MPTDINLNLRLTDDRQTEVLMKEVNKCLEAVDRIEGRYKALHGMYLEVLTAVQHLRQELQELRK